VAADTAFIAHLRAALAAQADPARAGPMQAYMKSAQPFLGIPAPERRRTAAAVIQAQPLHDARTLADTMQALWQTAAFREERAVALELASAPQHTKLLSLAVLPVLEMMIASGAWWDHCDGISGGPLPALLRRWPAEVKPVLRRWSRGKDLWLRRASFLCQRGLKGADFDAPLFYATLLPSIGCSPLAAPFAREFFIRKGIGWALRERSHAAPDEVIAFCDEYAAQLAPLTVREALKAIRRINARRTSSAAPASL
jgi:3-methyladenine DNA glycosylase AlkD